MVHYKISGVKMIENWWHQNGVWIEYTLHWFALFFPLLIFSLGSIKYLVSEMNYFFIYPASIAILDFRWTKTKLFKRVKYDTFLQNKGAVKSDSTHDFFGNACTKSGPLRFPSFPVVDWFCLFVGHQNGVWIEYTLHWFALFFPFCGSEIQVSREQSY
jgi:hypothetical protein